MIVSLHLDSVTTLNEPVGLSSISFYRRMVEPVESDCQVKVKATFDQSQ